MLNELYQMEEFEIVLNGTFGVSPNMSIFPYSYTIKKQDEFVPSNDTQFVFGAATPRVKRAIFQDFQKSNRIGYADMLTIIHPSSYIAPSTQVGQAVLIEPHVVISSQTSIGFGVNVKRGSCIGHHNQIGDYCDINPGSVLSGKVQVGEGTIIGSGTMVKDNIKIGKNCTIGVGSVVTKNIPDNSVAYGNPCKVIKQNDVWSI